MKAPIDSIAPHPENYREHDVGAIAVSLSTFGQTKPLIVQRCSSASLLYQRISSSESWISPGPDGWIVAGSGTWKAAKALGWKEIDVVFFDWQDEKARAYLVADNRLHERGRSDDEALGDLLTLLAQSGSDALDATGYDADDVDELLADLGRLPVPKAKKRPARDHVMEWLDSGEALEVLTRADLQGTPDTIRASIISELQNLRTEKEATR